MTQNLKSLFKSAFKNNKDKLKHKSSNNTNATISNCTKKKITRKKRFKNFLKFTTIAVAEANKENENSNNKNENENSDKKCNDDYLTKYNCKNKKIINCKINKNKQYSDDTISNILPFKPIATQLLIPPPVPPLPITTSCTPSASSTVLNKLKLQQFQIELKLNNATKDKPANIPMLIIKSYKINANINLKQVYVNKGSAVNALYLLDNQWIYIKTFDDNEGYIPKYCCEPFAVTSNRNRIKSKQNLLSENNNNNHTYMSIMDTNNINNETQVIKHGSQYQNILLNDDCVIDENITNLSLFSVSRLNIDSTVLTNANTNISNAATISSSVLSNSIKQQQQLYQKDRNYDRLCKKSTLTNNISNTRYTRRKNNIGNISYSKKKIKLNNSRIIKSAKKQAVSNREMKLTIKNEQQHQLIKQQQQQAHLTKYPLSSSSPTVNRNFKFEQLQCKNNINNNSRKRNLNLSTSFSSSLSFTSSSSSSSSSSVSVTASHMISTSSITTVTAAENNTNSIDINDQYDLLTKCTSADIQHELIQHVKQLKYYDVNNEIGFYQVLFDYNAEFKDDIDVNKGNIVYTLNKNLTNVQNSHNYEWIYVRPYFKPTLQQQKRIKSFTQYKQQLISQYINDFNATNQNINTRSCTISGFVPRNCLIKL